MRVTMLETRRAAPDGVNVVFLNEGDTYELPDDLAGSYIARGVARKAGSAPAAADVELETTEDRGQVDDKNAGHAEETKPATRARRRRRAA